MRGMRDRHVLTAMRQVPREAFVDPGFEEFAHERLCHDAGVPFGLEHARPGAPETWNDGAGFLLELERDGLTSSQNPSPRGGGAVLRRRRGHEHRSRCS